LFAGASNHKMLLHRIRRNIMCIEKVVRNFGFALAAAGIIIGLCATIEYQPLASALSHV
jgi:hypothetical protein